MADIQMLGVEKRYGGVVAVHPLDLRIPDGEFTVLVGPSGCGKSTTLRIVAGLEDATAGRILIAGKDVTRLEPKDRNIAMVFQNYALYPHKTVFENLAFGLRMRKLDESRITQRVRWAAGMLGMEDLLQRKPRQLSGGQMQRVALGRALVREPDAFLLDEPLSNLDAKLRLRMRDEIARLHQQLGSNMLYVTHDQVEAMTLGDRIVVMKDGRIQQVGAPLEVYDHPVNRFVAGFIGAPEMNFLAGRIEANGSVRQLACGRFRIPLDPSRWQDAVPAQAVAVGIRPEHVSLAGNAAGRSELVPFGVPLGVSLVEQLGAFTLATLEDDGIRLRAMISRDEAVRPGDTREVRLQASKLHLFDSGTGEAIGQTAKTPCGG